MQPLVYWIGKCVVLFIQALPLALVARLGRMGGAIAHVVDARHRRVALDNMRLAFPEKSEAEIKSIASEHFRRLGENYACAIKTSGMSREKAMARCEVVGLENFTGSPPNRVVAVGHFGNFELFTRFGPCVPGYRGATTYRGVPSAGFNRLLEELRSQSGCLQFERRTGAKALLKALRGKGIILGLLTDQHAGMRGAWGDFLGHDCSTTMAPAVLAHRYWATLNVAICYRVALAQWRIEVGPEVPLFENGVAREPEAVMRDVNVQLEAAVRRDPANWFWVHRRWRARPKPRPPAQPS